MIGSDSSGSCGRAGETRLQPMGRLLNLVVPGVGLILLRREWLGASLALGFGICGHIAVAGWLIAPAAIPRWLAGLATAWAALTWITSQVLCRRQSLTQEESGVPPSLAR